VLGPGEVGIGHLYLGTNGIAVPPDATYKFTSASKKVGSPLLGYFAPLKVSETSATAGNTPGITKSTVVGTVQNPRKHEVTGPFNVAVVCFDEGGKPIAEGGGFADVPGDSLAGGAQATFSVDVFNSDCPTYLVGSSGFDEKALRR
jgi:hypothetical protein